MVMPDSIRHPVQPWIPAFAGMTTWHMLLPESAYRFAFRIPNWSCAMMNLQMFADPSTIAYVGASR